MGITFTAYTSRTGDVPLLFKQRTVLLGANGTGKSRFLAEIRQILKKEQPDLSTMNIEGGRAIKIVNSLALNQQNFNQYRNFDQTFRSYQSKREGTLESRIFDALKSLEQISEKYKSEHSDAVTSWHARGGKDEDGTPCEVPLRKVDPLTAVFEAFSDIFPAIELQYSSDSQSLRCIKNGDEYYPSQMSDGEKQVFAILVDIIELAEKKSVLFVDEPELNLNPGLANRVWNSIEAILPEAIFVYATHSVSFALRETVDLLLVLSNEDANIQEISDISDLTRAEQEALVGNIPGLIESKISLVVEGDDESFDSIFYDWVLDDGDVSPRAVGGCEDVKAIVQRRGKWSKITPNVRLVGAVDRDYRPDTELSSISKTGVTALEVHEAESYLCRPELIVRLAEKLQTVEPIPSEATITSLIIEFCKRERLVTVGRRVSSRIQHRVGVSVPSKALSKIQSDAQLKTLFLHGAQDEMKKVESTLDEEVISGIIDSELRKVEDAISNQSVDQLLALFPGKELLKELSGFAGCPSDIAVVRAARHHLNRDDFQSISRLRSKLRTAIDKTSSCEPPSDQAQ